MGKQFSGKRENALQAQRPEIDPPGPIFNDNSNRSQALKAFTVEKTETDSSLQLADSLTYPTHPRPVRGLVSLKKKGRKKRRNEGRKKKKEKKRKKMDIT